jgi:hypothetical protein
MVWSALAFAATVNRPGTDTRPGAGGLSSSTPVWLATFVRDIAQLRAHQNTSPVRVSFTERVSLWPDPAGFSGSVSIGSARKAVSLLLAMATLIVAAAVRNRAAMPAGRFHIKSYRPARVPVETTE